MKEKGISLISIVLLIFLLIIVTAVVVIFVLNPSKNNDTNLKTDEIASNESSNKTNDDSQKFILSIGGYKVVLGDTTIDELMNNSKFNDGEMRALHPFDDNYEIDYNTLSNYTGTITDGYSDIIISTDENKAIDSISTYEGNQVDCGLVFDIYNSDLSLPGNIKIGTNLNEAIEVFGDYSYTGSTHTGDDGHSYMIYYWYKSVIPTGILELSVNTEDNSIGNINITKTTMF